MNALRYGRCPIIPECKPSASEGLYDPVTDTVTARVSNVMYEDVPLLCTDNSEGPLFTVARRTYPSVKAWAALLDMSVKGLATTADRCIHNTGPRSQPGLSKLANALTDQSMLGGKALTELIANVMDPLPEIRWAWAARKTSICCSTPPAITELLP